MNLRCSHLTICFLALLSAPLVNAGAASSAAVKITQKAGAKALEKSARATAEHAAAQAVRHLGVQGAEKAIEKGGLPLLQAAARHGDEVWTLARRVPEAAGCLGTRPEQALALARRLGDDALRLEARLPGLADKAAVQFGRQSLASLCKAPAGDIQRLVGYSERASSRELRDALWERWERRGSRFLDELDKHKMLILTGGLTWSMLDVSSTAAGSVSEVGQAAADAVRQMQPEAILALAAETGSGIKSGLVLAVLLCGSFPLLWLFLRHRSRHSSACR